MDKREEILQKMRQEGIELNISSPKIKTFWVITKSVPAQKQVTAVQKPAFEPADIANALSDSSGMLSDEILPDVGGIAEEIMRQDSNRLNQVPAKQIDFAALFGEKEEEKEEINYEDLTPREFKRLQKEKKKEEKEFNLIRKDAHKRGYDTGVLMQLDDPEQLYEYSDEEIDQIQAAGYINEDGFYDFIYPPDAESIRRERFSTKKILLIAVVGLFFVAMIALMVNGAANIF